MPVSNTGFKRKRFADILKGYEEKARDTFGADINTGETTSLGIMLRLMSWTLADIWQDIEDVYHSTDINSAEGNRLYRLASNRGVIPYSELKSSGMLSIVGTPGYTVVSGYLAKNGDGVLYQTVQDATLNSNGTALVSIEAVLAGSSGNTDPNTIIFPVNPNGNITAISNPSATSGGRDSESSPDFKARYFEEVQSPAGSGNPSQYKVWAKEVPGIYDARVFRAAGGGGNVLVVLLNADNRAPSSAVVAQANTYIQSVKPVEVTVTVRGVTEVLINITGTITLNTNADNELLNQKVSAAVASYLASLTDTIVRYNRISEAILSVEEVMDHEGLRVNGGTGNLELARDEVPIIGAVNMNS